MLNSSTENTAAIHEDLRAWAKGLYPLEAGIELLIRTGFATRGSWIATQDPDDPEPGDFTYWVDKDALLAAIESGYLSGGERRLLKVIASFLGYRPVDLYDALSGINRSWVVLILAAVAHASGSHEGGAFELVEVDGRMTGKSTRLTTLYPWPE